mgnify:FL=1|jgi:hypothetical protein|tara:strand:- start:2803 stop:3306 length:504 start_codon:yes stop_codon:yes gene_type:complete
MSADKEQLVQKIFGLFGRKPMQVQFDIYMEELDRFPTDVVEKLYNHVVSNCDRMPTVYEIKRIIKDNDWGKIPMSKHGYTHECLSCDNTGFVPYINKPKGARIRYYITNYKCDCAYGEEMSASIPSYFSFHKELQFTNLEVGTKYGAWTLYKCKEFNDKLNAKEKSN